MGLIGQIGNKLGVKSVRFVKRTIEVGKSWRTGGWWLVLSSNKIGLSQLTRTYLKANIICNPIQSKSLLLVQKVNLTLNCYSNSYFRSSYIIICDDFMSWIQQRTSYSMLHDFSMIVSIVRLILSDLWSLQVWDQTGCDISHESQSRDFLKCIERQQVHQRYNFLIAIVSVVMMILSDVSKSKKDLEEE